MEFWFLLFYLPEAEARLGCCSISSTLLLFYSFTRLHSCLYTRFWYIQYISCPVYSDAIHLNCCISLLLLPVLSHFYLSCTRVSRRHGVHHHPDSCLMPSNPVSARDRLGVFVRRIIQTRGRAAQKGGLLQGRVRRHAGGIEPVSIVEPPGIPPLHPPLPPPLIPLLEPAPLVLDPLGVRRACAHLLSRHAWAPSRATTLQLSVGLVPRPLPASHMRPLFFHILGPIQRAVPQTLGGLDVLCNFREQPQDVCLLQQELSLLGCPFPGHVVQEAAHGLRGIETVHPVLDSTATLFRREAWDAPDVGGLAAAAKDCRRAATAVLRESPLLQNLGDCAAELPAIGRLGALDKVGQLFKRPRMARRTFDVDKTGNTHDGVLFSGTNERGVNGGKNDTSSMHPACLGVPERMFSHGTGREQRR